MKKKWSEIDTKFLIDNYKKLTAQELAIKLDRTKTGIYSKLWDYKLTPRCSYNRFSDKEVKYLLNNYNKVSMVDLAKKLKRPRAIIQSKLQSLKLKGITIKREWTQEDLDFITKNKHLSTTELAKKMNSSRRMLELRVRELGLNNLNRNKNTKTQTIIFCSSCENSYPKTKDYFYFNRSNPNLLAYSNCKKCCKEKNRRSVSSNLDSYIKMLLRGIRTDSKRRRKNNIDCDIDLNYINYIYLQQAGKCAITGIRLEHEQIGGKNMKNISIDRIDSNGGYTKGNIQLVCTWANLSKTTLPMSEFKVFIYKAYKHLIDNENVNRDQKIA